MNTALARRIFKAHSDIRNALYIGVCVIHFHEFVDGEMLRRVTFILLLFARLIKPEYFLQNVGALDFHFFAEFVLLCRYGFRYLIAIGIGNAQNPAHVFNGVLCRHRAEGYYPRHVIVAVFSTNVVDNFFTTAIFKVHVEVGRGNTFGVQKTLEIKVVF